MYFIYEALVEDYRRHAKEQYERLQQEHHAGVLGTAKSNQNAISVKAKHGSKQPEQTNILPKKAVKEQKKLSAPFQTAIALPEPISVKEDNRPIVPMRTKETPKQTAPAPSMTVNQSSSTQRELPRVIENNVERPIPTLNKTPFTTSTPSEPLDLEPPIETRLIECPEGCGRSFNQKALEKHAKICKKVFQEKRKEFVAAEQREIQQAKEIVSTAPTKQSKADNKQKWKQESLAFRANMKKNKGMPLTQEEEQALKQPAPDSVQCQFCSRRFNKIAAEKHIPFCEKKSKKR